MDTNNNPGFFPWDYYDNNDTALGISDPASPGTKSNNYGYGAKFTIRFNMPTTGKNGTGSDAKDIKFKFSGDDDVWVFIDDVLVLDVGGAHGRVEGEINFANRTATTSGVRPNSVLYSTSGLIGDYHNDSVTKTFNELMGSKTVNDFYSDSTKEHVLTVFYLERGTLESNCKISFNFHAVDTLSIKNKYNSDKVNAWFKEE